jgi:SAM-dependent methyltransferase
MQMADIDPEDVQSFYERMPYPAPLTSLDKHLDVLRSPEQRRVRSLQMFPEGKPRSPQEILVAGCGTSQAARVAIREPDAHVTAIDISATSLGHLRALQQKHRLKNLELHQLSLLDIASLKRTFDQIICTGVLHHLPDPDQGLRSLREVLSSDGAMQIMVYAKYGRSGIYMMQEYCRLLGVKPTKEELGSLGTMLRHLPDDHPLAPLLHKVKDFLHPDALADALLHPQDRAYTVPELYEWLDRSRMSFGRWLEQCPYLPQCGAFAETPHAARLAALPEPQQHAAVELFRGTITQHSFIAYRDDRARATQPIRFSGEQWRSYVPVRIPWTRTVRQGLPDGATAVLLNLAHKHDDLYLPINAGEATMFAQIDGKRTLGEIELNASRENVAGLAPAFFKKLWEHDLIVIDASASARTAASESAQRSVERELV